METASFLGIIPTWQTLMKGQSVSTNASVDTPLTVSEIVIVSPRLSDFFSLVTTPCTVVVHYSSAAVNSVL